MILIALNLFNWVVVLISFYFLQVKMLDLLYSFYNEKISNIIFAVTMIALFVISIGFSISIALLIKCLI